MRRSRWARGVSCGGPVDSPGAAGPFPQAVPSGQLAEGTQAGPEPHSQTPACPGQPHPNLSVHGAFDAAPAGLTCPAGRHIGPGFKGSWPARVGSCLACPCAGLAHPGCCVGMVHLPGGLSRVFPDSPRSLSGLPHAGFTWWPAEATGAAAKWPRPPSQEEASQQLVHSLGKWCM